MKGIAKALIVIASLLAIGGCGGGGKSSAGSSNWDQMKWDQDNWA
jgi:hypothetical protein